MRRDGLQGPPVPAVALVYHQALALKPNKRSPNRGSADPYKFGQLCFLELLSGSERAIEYPPSNRKVRLAHGVGEVEPIQDFTIPCHLRHHLTRSSRRDRHQSGQ